LAALVAGGRSRAMSWSLASPPSSSLPAGDLVTVVVKSEMATAPVW